MLPSKTAPHTKRTKSQRKSAMHAKKKSRKATVEEVEDEDNRPQNIHATSPAPTQTTTSNKKKVCTLIFYL